MPTLVRNPRASSLATLTWIVRLGACVVIGVETFTGHTAAGSDLAFEYVIFALAIGVMGYWLANDRHGSASRQPWVRQALGLMAAVSGAAAAAPEGGGFLGFAAIGVLAVGADTDGLAGWVVAALTVLSFEVGAVVFSASAARVLGYPLVLLVAFITGRNRRAYRLQAEQSAAMITSLEQLRAEQGRVATLDERARIAREIHDVLAHSLGALGIQLQTARAVLADTGDVERATSLLDQAQRMASDGLTDTRRAVQALRGDVTRFDRQLADIVDVHRTRHQTSVDLAIDGEPVPLSAEATVALVRMTQEALVNAAKHAPHQQIAVRLSYDDHEVELLISNPLPVSDAHKNGSGEDVNGFSSVNGGYGLTGMRERLLLIKGSLDVGASSGMWTVAATVPR